MEFANINPETEVVVSLFLMATFFTEITMLNMLIAIMADSYGYATEHRQHFDIEMNLANLATMAAFMT